jgi:hypothetical protein
MANNFTQNPMVIDTASATYLAAEDYQYPLKINAIVFQPGAPNDVCTIYDKFSKSVIFNAKGVTGDPVILHFTTLFCVSGLYISVLTSGAKVYIYS